MKELRALLDVNKVTGRLLRLAATERGNEWRHKLPKSFFVGVSDLAKSIILQIANDSRNKEDWYKCVEDISGYSLLLAMAEMLDGDKL